MNAGGEPSAVVAAKAVEINQENLGTSPAVSKAGKVEEERQALVANAVDGIDVVRGKAVWSIGPGQLARRVSESEFAQLDNLKGVVIQDGVTAVISVDGQIMGMLAGGYYEFANSEIKERAMQMADSDLADEKATESFLVKAGNAARRVWRFLTGTKDAEKVEARKKREERVRRNIQRMTSDSTVNVSLVSTRIFELMFGSAAGNGGEMKFVPMTVHTRLVDVEIGASLQMQITNVNDFLVNNLADKKSFSVIDALKMVQPSIENLMGRILRNLDYETEGLPEELVDVIKGQIIKTVNERVYGLEVVKVLDITDKSVDFDRFRAVERELFVSDKELGYLQRTGEFRNRLAVETNRQAIDQAKNEEDLRYSLSQINKDGLLHDDEMDSFLLLLNSQKRLREAKTQEQEYEAMQGMLKSRLVKEEEVEILQDMLSRNELERSEVTELLRVKVLQSTEMARVKAENALSDLSLQHEFDTEKSYARHASEMTDLELEIQRKRDNYNFEQENRMYGMEQMRRKDEISLQQQQAEFERTNRRAQLMDDMDVLERKAAIARANMAKMQEHELKLEEMKTRTEELRIQTEATMTQEQIAAAHMKDIASLDADAQAEMARMMGSGKAKEAEMLREQQDRERQMYERMMQMMQQNQQGQQQAAQMTQAQMLQMMQTMMNGMAQVGNQRISETERMKEEYRAQAAYQQERTDMAHDRALDYTTRVTESAQENNTKVTVNQNITQAKPVFCPNCGGKATTMDKACPHCGESLDE